MMINFSVILNADPNIIAAIITAVIALIVGATTAFLFWWASTKQEKQQEKKHEEKMELQRLELLKSLSKLTEEQEKKYYELSSVKEKREYLFSHNPYQKKKH